jgi:hypothetical protein
MDKCANYLSFKFDDVYMKIYTYPIIITYISLLYNLYTVCVYYINNINLNNTKLNSHFPIINRVIASSHSCLMAIICIYYWTTYDNLFSQPCDKIYMIQYICLDTMNGYLIYDLMMDTLWNLLKLDLISIQMFIHHILGLISINLVRHYDSAPGAHYMMIVLLSEISTPFLHNSWTMYHLNYTNNVSYKITGYLLIVLFFVFRIVLSPYLIYKLIKERDIWSNEQQYLFEINLIISVTFMYLNYIWFIKLIKMALSKSKQN